MLWTPALIPSTLDPSQMRGRGQSWRSSTTIHLSTRFCAQQDEGAKQPLLQQRLEAVVAGRDAAEARARHLERLNRGLEADLSAALAQRESALDLWAQALSRADR